MKDMSGINKVLVFNEPSYPQSIAEATIASLVTLPYEIVGAHNLFAELTVGCSTLISFQGGFFPKNSWPAILNFLKGGGNLVIMGGMPFSRPVDSNGQAESAQQSYTRELFLGPFFEIPPDDQNLKLVPASATAFLDTTTIELTTERAGQFWAFYPKLTQVSDQPQDLGSGGTIDTILTPLLFAVTDRKIATPALLLDQREGSFAGGRWLISGWQPATEQVWLDNAEVWRKFILLAASGFNAIDIRPTLACYKAGEATELVISARTPSGLKAVITSPNFEDNLNLKIEFPPSDLSQEERICLPPQTKVGLYQFELTYQSSFAPALRQTTGFWLWDDTLVTQTAGKRLSPRRDYFYQQEHLFLVFGTTYMDSEIQRKFLTLPNPARWERDFKEMKAAGINLIRTGIWTGWREFMPLSGVPNETMLRAMDALVMTACKYDMQVIFTFFAFFPPLFEGENPWLDPRSIGGQQYFVAALARRYAGVEILSWDLINEPSFGNPQKIFAPRPLPNYDRFEKAAFRQWLSVRYRLEELQLRWRGTPAELPDWESVDPPQPQDYSSHVRDNFPHNMLKVGDYTLFSQEIFREWAKQMYRAIRAAGSNTLIGVGQDEAGARIAPQFYTEALDYTTTHPWWNNDNLLWDMLIDKTPFKPNIIQETGVMLVLDVDGNPWRTEQENAHLLERKLYTGLAVRSAGLVQWLWHTNAYMTNDNENSIGLVRADGSAKPELGTMQQFGQLLKAIVPELEESAALPEIWLIVPYSQWFLRPELGSEVTQQAVRILAYDCGVTPQLVGEHQLPQLAENGDIPRLIILPSVQVLEPKIWECLQQLVKRGAHLLVSGVISRDPHNLPFNPALNEADEEIRPVSRYEVLTDFSGQQYQLSYEGEKPGYIKKAHNKWKTYPLGQGQISWCGLPLELSNSNAVVRKIYRQVLGLPEQHNTQDCPILVTTRTIREGQLIIVISESSSTQKVQVAKGLEAEIEPGRAGAAILKAGSPTCFFGGLKVSEEAEVPLRQEFQ